MLCEYCELRESKVVKLGMYQNKINLCVECHRFHQSVKEKNMSMTIQTTNESDFLDQKKIDLVRNLLCKDATHEEFELFISVCKATKLNPLSKQIYFIKRGGKPTHQTSIDGLRLIADRTKRYVPGREPTYAYDAKGKLISATSYIKKLANDGSWHEVASTAFMSEYGATTGVWPKMPHIMLSKCAEALALRKAFPADMLGIYTEEEMAQADNRPMKEEIPTMMPVEIAVEKAEELISETEAKELEKLLEDEDEQYRNDILSYYTNTRRLAIPMKDFIGFPKRYMSALMKSIMRRQAEREKKKEVVEEAQEVMF